MTVAVALAQASEQLVALEAEAFEVWKDYRIRILEQRRRVADLQVQRLREQVNQPAAGAA